MARDIDEADSDPLAGLEDHLFDDNIVKLRPPPQQQHQTRRDWGIPSFQDQCNGCNVFQLQLQDEQQCLKLQLEHRKHSTGSDLWDAALVLIHAFEALQLPIQNTNILELGSGTGAVGLYLASQQAKHVILTDLPANLDLIRANATLNHMHNVSILPLDWMDPGIKTRFGDNEALDWIVGSDLFLPYAPHLLEPLAQTLHQLLALHHPPPATDDDDDAGTQALLAYEERFDCSSFFEHAAALHLNVAQICNDLLHPTYQDPRRIHVLIIRLGYGDGGAVCGAESND